MSDTDAPPPAGTVPAATDPSDTASAEAPPRLLSPAAQRALAEAAARRAEIDQRTAGRPKEYRGRGGLEPDRYGDWEVKGIASDF
jgi:hypothetical protein